MITDRIDPPELLRIPEIVNVSIATGARVIHISGQTSVDVDGTVVGSTHLEQSRVAFRNLLIALDAAGATLDDVAKFNIYMVDYSWDALEALMTAAKEVLGDPYPVTANTLVGVASLWLPDLLVEVDAVAVDLSPRHSRHGSIAKSRPHGLDRVHTRWVPAKPLSAAAVGSSMKSASQCRAGRNHRSGAVMTAVHFDTSTVDTLRGDVRGEILVPGDSGYDDARSLYNAMIDKRPAVMIRCQDVADVIAAVRFGRDEGLDIAIRGGGHNGGGLGSVDNGLIIDLSGMRGVRVDPEARTVVAAGGALLGDVDHATHTFGLATPGGIISTTGLGGLGLGGGVGHLTRKCGLTIDNFLAVDMVLADGSFVTANADEHEDLFWAVRGGGGNFGVVTSFTLELHEVSSVWAGPMLWPLDRTDDVLSVLPRLHRGGARRSQRLLRVPHRATSASVPRGAPPQEDVRHRVVLRRARGAGRRGVRSAAAHSVASRSTE